MQKPKFLTRKFIENVGRYVCYFLLVVLSPLLAIPMSGWFDAIEYNQINEFFIGVCTAVLWLIEFVVIVVVENVIRFNLKKKTKANETLAVETTEESASAQEPLQETLPKKKSSTLGWKRVAILAGICLTCAVVISAQIGFQVKPFYDIGDKITTGYDLLNKLGLLIMNIFKALWITMFVRASVAIAEEVFSFMKDGKGKSWAIWLLGGALLMAFGIYDVLAYANPFAVTYLLFYAVFTLVYFLTNKNPVKAGFIIFFIYIF